MYIRCPNCGRRGFLPDRLVPEANSLRCRKCRAHFFTPELAERASERPGGPSFKSTESDRPSDKSSSFLADGFFSGFDDDESPREPGPGDSNYELTFTLGDARDESGDDWEASPAHAKSEAPSSDEVNAVAAATNRSLDPQPWHHRFITSWGPPWIVALLGLIAVTVPLVGYLIWRTLGGGGAVDLPAPSLVAGLACAAAILVIAVPVTLLTACLTELGGDVRRIRDHLQRRA